MDKYILVRWPECQYFMDRSDCFLCFTNTEFEDTSMDGAYFVPEEVYNEIANYENNNTRTSN